MKIISWNVNGVRAIQNKGFVESIIRLDPDILCLQETKAQNSEVEETLSSLRHFYISSNSAEKKGYSGVSTLSKAKPIKTVTDLGVPEHDNEGRVICSEYPAFYLLNVYVPNSGQQLDRLPYRKTWDQDFLKYLKQLENTKPVIACGDFNVAHQPIDLKNDKANYNKTAGYTQIEIDGMTNFLDAGFIDAFRYLHPNDIAYTYWSYRFNSRANNTGWRIDYFLTSKSLMDKIKSVNILSDYFGSDHCPISLDIDV